MTSALLAIINVSSAGDLDPDNVLPGVAPDVRDHKLPVTFQQGDFLAVPVPTSNPTTGTGLIGVAAYFWGQTDEEKEVQPPSVTGLGGMYTDTDSWVAGIGHSAYWSEDRWRLSAVAGVADLNLPLVAGDVLGARIELDWAIEGELVQAQLSRRIFERWFLGFQGRYLSFDQEFSVDFSSADFSLPLSIEAGSAGIQLIRDTRDSTANAQSGTLFKIGGLYTRKSGSDNESYESYDMSFRSYHQLGDSVVLAWRGELCERTQDVPLWDTCRIGLRGFANTAYMGRSSQLGEIEARWQISKRWGAVVFGGAGQVHDSLSGLDESEVIPSYGLGLRFLVQSEQRINLRLDYGRSSDSDAIYFFVGEAF